MSSVVATVHRHRSRSTALVGIIRDVGVVMTPRRREGAYMH